MTAIKEMISKARHVPKKNKTEPVEVKPDGPCDCGSDQWADHFGKIRCFKHDPPAAKSMVAGKSDPTTGFKTGNLAEKPKRETFFGADLERAWSVIELRDGRVAYEKRGRKAGNPLFRFTWCGTVEDEPGKGTVKNGKSVPLVNQGK